MFRLILQVAELAIAYVVLAFLLKLVRGYFSRPASSDRADARERRDFGGRGDRIVDAEWEEVPDDPERPGPRGA